MKDKIIESIPHARGNRRRLSKEYEIQAVD